MLSAPHPGTQLYHSLLCIVLQFLILRLMGRTVTAVLTTFCVQMVNVSLPGQLRSQPAGLGAGGRTRVGVEKKPWTRGSTATLSSEALGQCPEAPGTSPAGCLPH